MAPKPYLLEQIEPYIHEQTTASDDVIIDHGKDKSCPPVMLILEDGETPFEAEIKYLDMDRIRIRTNKPIKFFVLVY